MTIARSPSRTGSMAGWGKKGLAEWVWLQPREEGKEVPCGVLHPDDGAECRSKRRGTRECVCVRVCVRMPDARADHHCYARRGIPIRAPRKNMSEGIDGAPRGIAYPRL